MGFLKKASEVWRDYITEGVPASGIHQPAKGDIRQWGLDVESQIELGLQQPVKQVADTAYTLIQDDYGYTLDFTAATSVTVTVPTGLSSNFFCAISQGGLGQVTVMPASGVTLNEVDGAFSTESRYVVLTIITFAQDVFRLVGRTI